MDLKGGELARVAGVGEGGAEGDRLQELFLGLGLWQSRPEPGI